MIYIYIYVAISCHFEIFIVKDCKINSIKLLQRFFQFKLLPKKIFLILFCIKASIATKNYKSLQLIIINVIIYHF